MYKFFSIPIVWAVIFGAIFHLFKKKLPSIYVEINNTNC